MSAILVSNDLMFASQTQAAGKQLGVDVTVVADLKQLEEQWSGKQVAIIDLGGVTGGLKRTIDAIRAGGEPECRFIAFAPHVHHERLTAARDAGCDEVLSRGQFHAQMDRVLRGEPGN